MQTKTKTRLSVAFILIAILGISASLPQVRDAGSAALIQTFPDTFISWDEAQASTRCIRAVEGDTAWPKTEKYKCRAMHMCAEKGELSDKQLKTLSESINTIPNCRPL